MQFLSTTNIHINMLSFYIIKKIMNKEVNFYPTNLIFGNDKNHFMIYFTVILNILIINRFLPHFLKQTTKASIIKL